MISVAHINTLTVSIHYANIEWSGKIVAKSWQKFDNVQRAIYFNQTYRGVDIMSTIAKNILLQKKYIEHLLSFFQKPKSTHTTWSVFGGKNELVKNTKIELKFFCKM